MIHPIKHFITITRHRHRVIVACFRCGIGLQGLGHDLSKYTPAEFLPGMRYYTGYKSPNDTERRLFGYSSAWMHHKGRNKHHYEYWSDFDIQSGRYAPVPMPRRYVAEMFCDRVAASQIYLGKEYEPSYPLAYYLNGADRRNIHPKTGEEIEFLLRMLAERGEVETYAYIRSWVKAGENG